MDRSSLRAGLAGGTLRNPIPRSRPLRDRPPPITATIANVAAATSTIVPPDARFHRRDATRPTTTEPTPMDMAQPMVPRKASHPDPLLVSGDGEQGPREAQDRGRNDHAESEDREHFAIGDRQDLPEQ